MLTWSIVFLVVAIVAGLLGFTSIVGTSLAFAKILFWLFVILFIISLIMGRRSV